MYKIYIKFFKNNSWFLIKNATIFLITILPVKAMFVDSQKFYWNESCPWQCSWFTRVRQRVCWHKTFDKSLFIILEYTMSSRLHKRAQLASYLHIEFYSLSFNFVVRRGIQFGAILWSFEDKIAFVPKYWNIGPKIIYKLHHILFDTETLLTHVSFFV